ncbi:MAG: Gut Q protein [Chlamydiae bacterium SM23_39]|nr:MAG: Gut Q protein [Chlamydiae bacterium SM23_39]
MVEMLFKKQKKYINYFFDNIDREKTKNILDELLKCRGNIVFTGVGKSGIIANKLAMTMSSLGSKSFYLSPLGALHGDIGLLSKDDIIIFLSRSGNTKELIDLVPFIKKKGLKIISFLSNINSELERLSDLYIYLPIKKEICPFNLAPTTSAAVQLIFGDILIVSLMQKKKFTLEDYYNNHPSGNIGKMLIKVEEVMLKEEKIPLCYEEDMLVDVIDVLSLKRCGCLLVIDRERNLKGIFTDGDLRRSIEKDKRGFLYKKMKELMTKNPRCISKDKLTIDAINEMEKDKNRLITVLAVVEEKKVIGIIRMHDILQRSVI